MTLPDSSNLLTVGEWRHIQSIREPPELRNPDTLVRYFLPLRERWRARWLRGAPLASLRSSPFYYYLLARTRYYDATFLDALDRESRHIVNIGCGTDTRSYRFLDRLRRAGVSVLECDQAHAIRARSAVVDRRWPAAGIELLALDLNDSGCPELESKLASLTGATFVQLEGVSPYVDTSRFSSFLELLAARLPGGSRVAYDFKRAGVNDDFGGGERTSHPFRLPADGTVVAKYHEQRGYALDHFELSDALTTRLVPQLARSGGPLFLEDGLVQLSTRSV